MDMINGVTGTIKTTRYNRRSETLALLHYVHGGESGALIGAWDFLTANITGEKLEDLFASYKRGVSLETYLESLMINISKVKQV